MPSIITPPTNLTPITTAIASLQAGQTSGFIAYQAQALLFADLAHAVNTPAMVTNDTTVANNGYYTKVGVSGSGSWVGPTVIPVTTNSVGTAAIQSGAVLPVSTSFFGPALNLINTADSGVAIAYAINATNGALIANSNCTTSGYIPVTGGASYQFNQYSTSVQYSGYWAWYDVNRAFISSGSGSLGTVTAPSNAVYFRIAVAGLSNFANLNFCSTSITLPTVTTRYPYGIAYINPTYMKISQTPGATDTNPITSQAVYNSLAAKNPLVTGLGNIYTEIKNLLDPTAIVTGCLLSTGAVNTAATTWQTSGFIPALPTTEYHIPQAMTGAGGAISATGTISPFYGLYACYDTNQNMLYVSAQGSLTRFTTPANTAYIRYSIISVGNLAVTCLAQKITKLPYVAATNPAYGVQYPYNVVYPTDNPDRYAWNCCHMTTVGDSLVAMGHWQNQVCSYFNMEQTNCGVGGSCVGGTSLTINGGEVDPMWMDSRINAIPPWTDLIFVHGGTNDNGVTPMGAITLLNGNMSALDTTTFYGAYQTMLNKMMTIAPNARIVLLIPFWNSEDGTGTGTLDTYRASIRAIGTEYGFPVYESVEMFGFNYLNFTPFYQDNTHINLMGGNRVADCLCGFLKTIAPYNNVPVKLNTYAVAITGTGSVTLATLSSNVYVEDLTWVSANTAVATVANGVITGVATGTTTVTATDSNNNVATVTVTVT
jgi:hypothetical protein